MYQLISAGYLLVLLWSLQHCRCQYGTNDVVIIEEESLHFAPVAPPKYLGHVNPRKGKQSFARPLSEFQFNHATDFDLNSWNASFRYAPYNPTCYRGPYAERGVCVGTASCTSGSGNFFGLSTDAFFVCTYIGVREIVELGICCNRNKVVGLATTTAETSTHFPIPPPVTEVGPMPPSPPPSSIYPPSIIPHTETSTLPVGVRPPAPPQPPFSTEINSKTCGLKGTVGEKIIGGSEAEPGEWPWVVLLLKYGQPHCGASLIDSKHLITAAHCIVSIMKEVEVPVWSNRKCQKAYGIAAPGGILDSMLCAGNDEEDACDGDSGGPLMYSNDGVRYDQIGIVSWGINCGKKKFPGVYTRISYFMDWIKRNV